MAKILSILSLSFLSFFAAGQKIPILGFVGIPESNATVSNYKKMKEAGFSISLMTFSDHQNALKALDAASQSNIKLILSYPELYSEPQESISKIKNHAALGGYYLGDEPRPRDFKDFKKFAETIKVYDPAPVFYANLFPNYTTLQQIDGLSYIDYIRRAINEIPFSFISFDNYPLVNNKVRPGFYENLELVRRESGNSNKPFWAFACTAIHFDYLKPTLAGLKLQQFSNLLYGAQGLQYFTYWTMTSDPNWKKDHYSYAIVDDQGNPTPTYTIVKELNEQIQRVAWVFLGAKSDAVFHIGDEIPQGTTKLKFVPEPFQVFSTRRKNAMISFMTASKNKFIIIQNKSLSENLILDYKLKSTLKKVHNLSGKEENLLKQKMYSDIILPGDILIFVKDRK
ncbi:hypothetical protein [uncultured Chryseobacterium sp.]|uniref:hypothetical protein n=1 Tax=uncultured Chryseobacterium sp. TaxID=259322 RepID=UPI0025FC9DB2|nr:hypothetical protein [uncultured Chryseobacterium sp.]